MMPYLGGDGASARPDPCHVAEILRLPDIFRFALPSCDRICYKPRNSHPPRSARMITLDIFHDPICPWCYIGKTRLDRALEALSLIHI